MSAIAEAPPSKWPTARRIWLGVCVGAFVLAIALSAKGASNVHDFTDGPTFDAPGPATVHLDSGRWLLYDASGSHGFVTFRPSDVKIEGPNERTITARDVTGTQTLTSGGVEHTAAAEFTAPTAGDYTITVHGSSNDEVLVARSISDSIAGIAVWFVPAALAGLLALVGLILVLVNPWKPKPAPAFYPPPSGGWQPPPPGVGPPPGWYTDPWDASGKRWWDGATWTGHTNPGAPT